MAANVMLMDHSPVSVTICCARCGRRVASTPTRARVEADEHLALEHPAIYRNTVKARRRRARLVGT